MLTGRYGKSHNRDSRHCGFWHMTFVPNAQELLAQAIWMGQFGATLLDPRWIAWAQANPDAAAALRKQAQPMLDAATPHTHHSLGWLRNG